MSSLAPSSRWVTWTIRIVAWLIPLVALGYGLAVTYYPFGRLTIRHEVSDPSSFVQNFASKEPHRLIGVDRRATEQEAYQVITVSPFYFDIAVPRPFQRARVRLVFRNPDDQPLFRIGVQHRSGATAFEDLAVFPPALRNLGPWWLERRDGNLVLWQKDKTWFNRVVKARDTLEALEDRQLRLLNALDARIEAGELTRGEAEFERVTIDDDIRRERESLEAERDRVGNAVVPFETVDAFLASPPNTDRVATANFDLQPYVRLRDYRPDPTIRTFPGSLRGPHVFSTYVDGENLSFTFTFQDINRHAGADPVSVEVTHFGGRVFQETLPDDGDVRASGRPGPERTLTVSLPGAARGIYRFSIRTNDDLFTKRIETTQQFMTFEGNLYLTSNPEYETVLGTGPFPGTNVVVDGTYLRARTSHRESLQTLRTDRGSTLTLRGLNESGTLRISRETTVDVPKNDVYLETDGYFAPVGWFFNPRVGTTATLSEETDPDGYDFLLVSQPVLEREGEWLVVERTISGPALAYYNGAYHFVIQLPGLSEQNRTIEVRRVEVILEKSPLTLSKLFSKFKQL